MLPVRYERYMDPIVSLAPDLWTIRHPAAGVGGLGTRTTLVRLPTGGLWLHSPGDLAASRAEIDALGPVTALVAPSKFHHLYLPAAHGYWPAAHVYLAPGLRERVPALPSGEVLSDNGPWSPTIEQLHVGGVSPIEEIVFLHRPSRTLILCDLVFNVRPPVPWHTRVMMTFNGGFARFGPTNAFKWLILRDRAALRRSLDAILAWDFDRVTVTHGDVLETGGKEAFRHAFSWV
jgi:hypothetical protein